MINIVDFLTEQVNDWINADRQEKIVSFQILLAGIIFLIIIWAWNTHKQAIFQLKDFIEQGQRNLQNLHEAQEQQNQQDEQNRESKPETPKNK
jgi:hypothetical protein